MGSVYRAVDENLGVEVAVKENLFTTEDYARQFRLEAVILANLRHPNLPRVSDHFVIANEGQYLIMDYIGGEDLRERMERIGILPADEVIHIGAAMCDALTYLHTRRPAILHRDIKPGNVKITPEGNIYLVDFGLAKVIQGNQATTTGARAMTPGYSPPEQYGTARTDARTDIYSLGATLYAALTGVIPEDGLARAMDNAQLTPVRKRNAEVPRRLAAALEKAMEVDPGDRYQLADDFKQAMVNSMFRTQQLPVSYSIPPISQAAERKGELKNGSILEYSTPIEGHSFISPRKKQVQKTTRLLRFGGITALVLIVLGLTGIAVFGPQWIPLSVRAVLPFQPPGFFNTDGTVIAPPVVDPGTPFISSATPTLPLSPGATQAAVPGVPGSAVPTLIGGEYLQLAYASMRTGLPQIYYANLVHDQVRQITNMPGGACQPSWSPDGNRLVFTSPCDVRKDTYPESSLFIINVDGTGLQPLPTAPGGDFEPAWSPDGKYIAFTSVRNGYMQIYSYNVENGEVLRLVRSDTDEPARQASWSVDGTRIIYIFRRVSNFEIWEMTSLGENDQQLFTAGTEKTNSNPIYSPDGQLIIFNQQNAAGVDRPNLYSLSVGEGSPPLRLSLGLVYAEDAQYSPDGIWLAYESSGERGQAIYYSTPSGGNQVQVKKDYEGDDFDPAWRPIQSVP
jgi:serine/threonine protein kinase